MKTRKRIVFIAVAIVAIGGFAWLVLRPHELVYQGRALSFWLKQLDDGNRSEDAYEWSLGPVHRAADKEEAAQAIIGMGTNTLPYLLAALTAKDPSVKLKIIEIMSRQPWVHVPLRLAAGDRRAAALAFDALGPMARPACPQLSEIFRHQVYPKGAAIALAALGPEGWKTLSEGISGTNEGRAVCAIWALGSHRAAVPGTLPTLMAIVSTNGPASDSKASIAAWALGAIGQESEQVVPVLINALGSRTKSLPWAAALGLGLFGTNATSAVPALLEMYKSSDKTRSGHAARALKAIDPEAAAKAGVK